MLYLSWRGLDRLPIFPHSRRPTRQQGSLWPCIDNRLRLYLRQCCNLLCIHGYKSIPTRFGSGYNCLCLCCCLYHGLGLRLDLFRCDIGLLTSCCGCLELGLELRLELGLDLLLECACACFCSGCCGCCCYCCCCFTCCYCSCFTSCYCCCCCTCCCARVSCRIGTWDCACCTSRSCNCCCCYCYCCGYASIGRKGGVRHGCDSSIGISIGISIDIDT
mmetsp:Transcript_11283/g.13096  ORF Transcript_11283/g.13096 Transcript_11283/m.13096 type:complete len:218 (-) Transcript_11283:318-971(-)